jgi:alpha-beta hydrolase superfamily lysophospholipase
MKSRTPYGKAKIYSVGSQSPEAERVLVVPGYSETIAHSKKLVDALADEGFNASTFSQPRRAGQEVHRVKDPIQRQGNVILSLVETTVPEGAKIHAVAHSLGTAAVLRAAQEAPERFASITLMQPVGMVGQQSIGEMTGRVSKKVIKNQVGALHSQVPNSQPERGYAANVDKELAFRYLGRVVKAQLASSKVLATQPILAHKEAIAAGKYGIADDIAKVTELGIPVHMVTAHSDELFDGDKVHAGYEAGIAATSYSTVADPEARHDTFWMQPRRTAGIVRQLIHEK